MEMISSHWDQILLLGAIVYHAARSYALLSELRKDVDTLQTDNHRLLDWTQKQAEQIVELRAEVNVLNKQITSLWEFTNSIRDRLNGHGKH
tara:strand:- start:425 stop:697 length:273 start_codon:yes stop_codon:yes gene_type:complete